MSKEECHARSAKKAADLQLTSEARERPRVALEEWWQALPEEDRRQTLRMLSRIVAQQLVGSQARPEVRGL